MAQKKHLALTLKGTAGAGTAVDVTDIVSGVIEVTATTWGSGSYSPMVSYDGSHFIALGSALTANGSVNVPDAAVAVRVDTGVIATTGPAAVVAGVRSTTAL